jgi:hypothetical protein
MKYLVISLFLLLGCPLAALCRPPLFAVVNVPAPVLTTPDFRSIFGGSDGESLSTDRCGQVRELEYIALPGFGFT